MDKRKLMLEYLDSSYPDIQLKYNELTETVYCVKQEGINDWYTEKLYLGLTLSNLFSCTPTEAHSGITAWERNKLFKK